MRPDGFDKALLCQGWLAGNALQNSGSTSLKVSPLDADFRRMISAWDGLPEMLRRAVLPLAAIK
jgi:hypothetical protein